ncbi:sensor histidine kinase [Thetidibacter halocola]|uniref:histidine kinase n=1 Tax=Thetidibacter halocola TaxID=2827239 RepID=A0A8J7WDX7_9RHOB|nr:sensor histidine kinase [Thetidibacter halocola]MBS0123581.1 sensor histidine kinase [Thetidibacter halocola]
MDRLRAQFRRLPVRLIALLSLALFPLGLIALYQTDKLLEEARMINRASLMERTVAAAAEERELIQHALGAARALGAVVQSIPQAACTEALRDFIDSQDDFIFVGYTLASGELRCSSRGVTMDLSGQDRFRRAIAAEGPTVQVTASGAVTGQPVVIVFYPVDRAGVRLGYMAISIPLHLANDLIGEAERADGLHLAVINTDGAILTATGGAGEAVDFLPASIGPAALANLEGRTFEADSGTGEPRIFAVGTMISGSAVVVGSWPAEVALDGGSRLRAWAPLTFPVVMWLTGMLVAYFGVQRLVIRHITQLRSAMRQYALGALHGGRIEMDDPPEELRETERAFNRMVLLLAQAEAQQEQDLRDKEVLLREVHHRVKNNLQLVGSIMNMMARNARTPEARRMLESLQRRVRGLAMLHRTLYTTPEMTTVDGAEMLRALIGDVTQGTRMRDLTVESDLCPVDLFPDQAVPLSMILAEAMTNAVKYCGRPGDGSSARIAVTLACDPASAMVELRIENTRGRPLMPNDDDASIGDGLGQTLMTAFERQLGGVSTVEDLPDRYVYSLRFERRDFEPGAD